MMLTNRLKVLGDRVPSIIDRLETEEATKNALIMPFLSALGYDVFDPAEVVPEFTADVGTKKGEKVDYAILRDNEVIFLVEAKKVSVDLSQTEFGQLYRYFTVTKARIAILTNGIIYRFYTDLEKPNIMDDLPFLEVDLRDLKETELSELGKMSKDSFDLERMLSAASNLKYMSAIKGALEQQWKEPSDEFVKLFFSFVHPERRYISSAREEFTPLVKRALQQFIAEKVGKRLRTVLEHEDVASGRSPTENHEEEVVPMEEVIDDGIETTEEEMEGFHIVKSIIREVVSSERITYRDTKSYFGILLDNNNRKPVCRLHFNRTQKYLGLFDDPKSKKEERIAIDSIDSIYEYSDRLREMAIAWGEA